MIDEENSTVSNKQVNVNSHLQIYNINLSSVLDTYSVLLVLGHDWKIPILGNLHIFEGSHESLWFSAMLKLKENIIELMDMLVMHYCRAHIWTY